MEKHAVPLAASGVILVCLSVLLLGFAAVGMVWEFQSGGTGGTVAAEQLAEGVSRFIYAGLLGGFTIVSGLPLLVVGLVGLSKKRKQRSQVTG
jgi:hypothetical protein